MIHTFVDSPIGPILLTGDGVALTGLYTREHGRPPALRGDRDDLALAEVRGQLDEYFTGTRAQFDLQISQPGTPFQTQVWKQLGLIGYGQVASYGQVAARVASPKAVRAVGSANGRNQISIIVPCHRVIASSGKLSGYAGGLSAKQWLLQHEATYRDALGAASLGAPLGD